VVYQRPTKKSLGQHFLIDGYIIDRILRLLDLVHDDCVIEIGPGSGCLTDHIVHDCAQLCAIELDADCVGYLNSKYSECDHFSVLHKDFLSLDVSAFQNKHYRWVGNLPYNVSVPILLRLMDFPHLIKDAVLMLQKEVALRCCAQVGNKHYGRIGIMLQCVFDIYYCFDVPPQAFSPPPKVESAVVRMVVKDNPKYEYLRHPHFQTVLVLCFNQRRKMLRKIFQQYINQSQWQEMRIDSRLRPEQVTVDDFYQIACAFQEES
tara:strand:- start:487 stop:1272 length:786 start_codon:yes stop_codon:yes gene_type:complete